MKNLMVLFMIFVVGGTVPFAKGYAKYFKPAQRDFIQAIHRY